MKVFFVGDFKSDSGPAIANRMIRRGLKGNKNIMYSDANNKIIRIIELLLKIFLADCVCFCSLSKINIVGIKISKIFRKKMFYIMHGYLQYESSINFENIDQDHLYNIRAFEKYIFKNVNKIICVSKMHMNFMKINEPEFENKFDYNFNAIDVEEIQNIKNSVCKKERNPYQLISLGGGMRRKNNLIVCQAIEKLNKENKLNIKYIVIGLPYTDKEEICRYDFVSYFDSLPRKIVLEYFIKSNLYIQNSIFETFGLAPIEALLAGCSLLISNEIGAKDVISTLNEEDVISNTNDIAEIARKIKNLLANGNSDRLREGLLIQEIQYDKAAKLLLRKMLRYCGG